MSSGNKVYDLAGELFPICRSITGKGVRKTLRIINEYIQSSGYQLSIIEVPSGTQVFDWTVPKEWEMNDGYVEDEDGNENWIPGEVVGVVPEEGEDLAKVK